jgi:hypothetical protein
MGLKIERVQNPFRGEAIIFDLLRRMHCNSSRSRMAPVQALCDLSICGSAVFGATWLGGAAFAGAAGCAGDCVEAAVCAEAV